MSIAGLLPAMGEGIATTLESHQRYEQHPVSGRNLSTRRSLGGRGFTVERHRQWIFRGGDMPANMEGKELCIQGRKRA